MIRHKWFNQIFLIEKSLSIFVFIIALWFIPVFPSSLEEMKAKEKNNHYDNKNGEQIKMQYETKKARHEKPKEKCKAVSCKPKIISQERNGKITGE